MYLHRQGHPPPAVLLKRLPQRKNRQEMRPFRIQLQMERGKRRPGEHRNVEGIVRLSRLGRKAGGGSIPLRVLPVSPLEHRVVRGKFGPDNGEGFRFRMENGIAGMHRVKNPDPVRGQGRAELRERIHGIGQQIQPGRIQLHAPQRGNVHIHRHRIGAAHLVQIMLIIFPAIPIVPCAQRKHLAPSFRQFLPL